MLSAVAGLLTVHLLFAQGRFGGGQMYVPPGTKTAREIGSRSVGTPEWENPSGFRTDRFVELPIEHPLYRMVLTIREKAAVPNIRMGLKIANSQVHHRVIMDAKGRIVVMGLHNSDDSDGWEREGENHEYFAQYAEKIAYPLAVNIVCYIMTH